jgi:hypothetical protein
MTTIGRLSYSWYLWHWPVIVIGSVLTGQPSLVIRVALAFASLGLAALSYRWVESPIRHSKRVAAHASNGLAMAAILAAVGITTSLAWKRFAANAEHAPDQLIYSRAKTDGPPKPVNDCVAGYFDVNVADCVFGDPQSRITVALIGDSHAVQWVSAFEQLAKRRGWRLMAFTKSACAPVDVNYIYPALGREYTECKTWRDRALARIAEVHPLVTVVASADYQFSDEERARGMRAVWSLLTQSSGHVMVIRDNPRPEIDLPMCLARHAWRPSWLVMESCEFAPPDSHVYDLQRETAREFKNLAVVDISGHICAGTTCNGVRDGMIVFRDSNHLTESFTLSLTGVLEARIDELIGPPSRDMVAP